jgi:two-component system, chemotaxis family, CheB/CheR fusion protein
MRTTSTTNKRKPTAPKESGSSAFPIVAIGASAGGLEAVTELLTHLSPTTGMAFIYVQHLSPDHKSMLTSLLAKVTSMKVQEVENKVIIQPDNLYVIPPDKQMRIADGHINLAPRPEGTKISLPIDILFASLAESHKENVIGIVLSGSASDGTRGMKSIKQEGGLTFAQDETAKFNSMPKSAIAAGAVDFILSPKEIAIELTRLSKHPFLKTNGLKSDQEDLIANNDPNLKTILSHLQKKTGVDFSAYKIQTIKRRIIRRMVLYKLKDINEYTELIGKKNEELDILYQDLLINVTSFFRDSETHKYLKTTLLPRLLKSKTPKEPLRIWVPACSTGEEAFSIAMMLLEIQDTKSSNISIQIFATDLSASSIKKARIGLYSKAELDAVSPKRIQRFFTKSDSGYRIAKAVRDLCVFAPHNILLDPPFSRVDLISCRNLFIYLDTLAQKRSLAAFYFALNDNGYLMLGKSETVSAAGHLFMEVHKKFKIFSRKNDAAVRTLPPLSPQQSGEQQPFPAPDKAGTFSLSKTKSLLANRGLDSAIDTVLVADFMPACVVINHQMEILQFRGATDLFLTHASGKATFNILKMARPEIAFGLRNAITKVIKSKTRVRKSGIEMKLNAAVYLIGFEVVPLNIDWEEPLILILFSEQIPAASLSKEMQQDKAGKSVSLAKDQRIKSLEEELAAAHADALAFSHEQESFIEELQSAHQEVVSSNEELQTVNEELETSKEEIESTNEELITANQELQVRNDLLSESYDYSNAVISTLHDPMIVLDKDLRVKTANRSFYKKFGVNEEETEGVLLYDLGNKQWNIPRLRELLEDIVPKNAYFHDYEVTHTFPEIGTKTLVLNASRIVQKSHGERLILLSIKDITEMTLLRLKEKETLKKDMLAAKSYNLKLEKAVKERTRELKEANIKLAEKNAELEKMNTELEAFAYVSSHDLQEPLRKIQTFAGRILEKENQKLSDEGKNYFRLMRSSAERMQSLIQDLLAFSHVGRKEKKFEIIDLHAIVEEVKAEFIEHIEEEHATIEVKGGCKARVIPFQFRQVLTNLISNGIKFAQPGIPPHITITCQNLNPDKIKSLELSPHKEYIHISIADNGIGFEKEYSEKIFEVFQKLHSKDEYAGTGIGLAIVKKIIENHNGAITATSELNKGTTFNIFIPSN